MQWIELTIKTTPAAIDLVCDRLTVLGFDSFIIDDQEQFHDFLEQNRQYWDYVDEGLEKQMEGLSQIRLYLEQSASAPETIEGLKSQLAALRTQYPSVDFGSLDVQLANVKDEDWENNWKQYYKPLPIGEKLVVVPAWEEQPADGRVALRLDPGLIFGTGSHATTRMCLEAIETLAAPDKRVLDLGCGSGILSIGALVLGCKEAVGCDIDPKAPDVAMDNAALNGIGADRFRVYAGDILADRGMRAALGTNFDIVLANIVADVILPLAPLSREFLAPGGTFVTSGIIEGRQDEIEHALKKAGYSIEKHFCEEEWHCFVCSVRE